MISAVLDTNALASGFVGFRSPASTPGEILRRWQAGAFALVTSDHIITELTRTFTRLYFTERRSPEEIDAALMTPRTEAAISPITVRVVGVATSPKDDVVLATAISARVDVLVTGDKQVLAVGDYRGVAILSPREFLDLLEREVNEGN